MRRIVSRSALYGIMTFFACSAVWDINPPSHDAASPVHMVEARFPDELDYFQLDPDPNRSVDRVGLAFDVLFGNASALTLPDLDPSDNMQVYSVVGASPSNVVQASPPDDRKPQPKNALFNDAQIASIRVRLALDQDQEQHWPAVEAAWRNLAWQRSGRGGRSSQTAFEGWLSLQRHWWLSYVNIRNER
jgi:hypothetical protein